MHYIFSTYKKKAVNACITGIYSSLHLFINLGYWFVLTEEIHQIKSAVDGYGDQRHRGHDLDQDIQ